MEINENVFEQIDSDEIEQEEFETVSEHLASNGITSNEDSD